MNEGWIVLIIAVLAFMLIRQKGGLFGPADSVGPAVGPPPSVGGGDLTSAIGGAVGAGACIGGAAVFGAAAAGAVFAPVCAKVGASVAPYVVEGAEAIGHGAVWGATQVAGGAKAATKLGLSTLTNPLSTPLVVTNKLIATGTSAVSLLDRGVNAAYSHLPVPVKLAVAPLVLTEKVSAKAVAVGSAVVQKTGSALVTGAKAAEHAVTSVTNKILGFL